MINYKLRSIDEMQTKSPLCYSLKELKLPCDATDSKSWVLPLLLEAMPSLTSLGEANINDGLKLMLDLPEIRLKRPLRLTEAVVNLDEANLAKLIAENCKRLTSWTLSSSEWTRFTEARDEPSLAHWVATDLKNDLKEEREQLCEAWGIQIKTLTTFCPLLKTIKLSIKPGVSAAASTWQTLASSLKSFEDLRLKASCMTDIITLLEVIGHKLTNVSLTFFESSGAALELINVVPFHCPNLKKVFYGFLPGGPHDIDSEAHGDMLDPSVRIFLRMIDIIFYEIAVVKKSLLTFVRYFFYLVEVLQRLDSF